MWSTQMNVNIWYTFNEQIFSWKMIIKMIEMKCNVMERNAMEFIIRIALILPKICHHFYCLWQKLFLQSVAKIILIISHTYITANIFRQIWYCHFCHKYGISLDTWNVVCNLYEVNNHLVLIEWLRLIHFQLNTLEEL